VETKYLKVLRETRPGFQEEVVEGWNEIKTKFEIDKEEVVVCEISGCRTWW
jgi:hypothetical protein